MNPGIGVAASALALFLAVPFGWAQSHSTEASGEVLGRLPFTDPSNPPAYRTLNPAERVQFDLGHAVFNTPFVPAQTPNAGRRAGLGPLFNAVSCDECHNEGAHGRGPSGDGPAPAALVMELQRAERDRRSTAGDPVYGHVLNVQAVDGVQAEGALQIHYRTQTGHFADGSTWALRVPRYELTQLAYGPLDPATILAPRIAPPLFGLGLLEAVLTDAGAAPGNRFNWQGNAASVADQTARALSREMGLTSSLALADDCTPAEASVCAAHANPDTGSAAGPELQESLLQALLDFERWAAVPAPGGQAEPVAAAKGARLFADLGCESCHRARLQVSLPGEGNASIAPYSDLQLHNLGALLEDRTVGGLAVTSHWRTAPLWGIGYRLHHAQDASFLHDGRARSIEEAILWHGGEAQSAHDRYLMLDAGQRASLLQFIGTL